jgi:hypothetical protein
MKTFAAVLMYLLWLVNIFDYFTTKIILHEVVAEEINPIMNWMLINYGINGILIFKLVFLIGFTILVWKMITDILTNREEALIIFGLIFLNIIYYTSFMKNNMPLWFDIMKPYFT